MKHKILNPEGTTLAMRVETYIEHGYALCHVAFCGRHTSMDDLRPQSLPYAHPLAYWSVRAQMGGLSTHSDPPESITFYADDFMWGQFGGFRSYELASVARVAAAFDRRVRKLDAEHGRAASFAERLMRVAVALDVHTLYSFDGRKREWRLRIDRDLMREEFSRQERIGRSLLYPSVYAL